MGEATAGIVSIAIAIVGLAIIAVLVSNKAQTGQVIGAATQGFGYDLEAAVSPVTGTTPQASLGMGTSYPG